jgi:hypothetical protein
MSEKKNMNFKPAIGIDVGTFTIVVARRNAEGDIEYKHDINGYFEVEINNQTNIMINMLKQSKAPIYTPPDKKRIFVLGKKAREIAYSWSSMTNNNASEVFGRTMRDGILSSADGKDTFNVLATMVNGMARPVTSDNVPIAYSVPGTPYDRKDTTTEYHEKIIRQMLSKIDGKTPDPFSMNEALAIIYAECEKEGFTGIGMSFGAGMTNVCLAITGIPVFSFSIIGGGDSIDREAGKHCGVDPVVTNVIKMGDEERPGIDLTVQPTGSDEYVQRAIIMHYQILIEKVVSAFSEFSKANNARVMGVRPPIVVAGGTSSPNGFLEMLESKMRKADLGSLTLGEFRKPEGNLFTVAKGLLRAAETYERG